MLPLTNAPRLPNIGFSSTRGSSGTIERRKSLSCSVGFGICIPRPQTSTARTAAQRQAAHPDPIMFREVLPAGRSRRVDLMSKPVIVERRRVATL